MRCQLSNRGISAATPAARPSHISQRAARSPPTRAVCPTETKSAGGLGSVVGNRPITC